LTDSGKADFKGTGCRNYFNSRRQTIMKRPGLVLLIVLFTLFLPGLHRESLAAPYYEGKIIRIIVGYQVGGGYDRMARIMARHLGKYIPGKPAIIVENMVGASSMIATNYLYNVAKPDGFTIGIFDRNIPFTQLLKMEGVKFDVTKFAWIGSTASETFLLAMRADLPFKNVDDLKKAKEPINLAGGAAGASDTTFPTLLKEFAGFNFTIINYDSSASEILAIERKEADGRAGSYSSLKPYIVNGLLRPLIRCRVSEPGVENLPVNEDLTTNKMGKTIMALMGSADYIGRPFVAPPKTPAPVMTILRSAFAKAAQDPQLREEAKRMMMSVNYTSADETLKVLKYVMSQPDTVVREFRKYMATGK
jgi:tripartite-type tricarboxylate transporter receptor subunit TctC